MKSFKLNIFAFIIAFAIGIFYVYISTPKPKVIIKYPTPYNANNIVYRHKHSDNCYKYQVEEIKCTANTIEQPII
jgi:hypothetical protein